MISLISMIPLRAQSLEGFSDKDLSYQKIILCEGKRKEVLVQELQEALYRIYDSAVVQKNDYDQIIIKGSFTVYNTVIGKIGNPAGQVDFTLTMDVKTSKYRYTATEFYFTQTRRDRYGRFKMSNEQPVLINNDIYSSNKALFKKIQKQSKVYLDKLQKALMDYLTLSESRKVEW